MSSPFANTPTSGEEEMRPGYIVSVTGTRESLDEYLNLLRLSRVVGQEAGVHISGPEGYMSQHYSNTPAEELPLGTYLLDYCGGSSVKESSATLSKRLQIDEGNITELGIEILHILDDIDEEMPTQVVIDPMSKLFQTQVGEDDASTLALLLSDRIVAQSNILFMTVDVTGPCEEIATVKSLSDCVIETQMVDGELQARVCMLTTGKESEWETLSPPE